jgi:hypothetical protein
MKENVESLSLGLSYLVFKVVEEYCQVLLL